MPLNEFQARLNKLLTIDFEVAYQNAMIEGEGVLIELLQSQLSAGLTGDETPILLYESPEYSPFTVKFKKAFGSGIGSITDHITLYMFGEFYARMRLHIRGGDFSIISDVSYYEKIIHRSGLGVMKVSKANMDSFFNLFIKPALEKELLKFSE
jgi:hypothetical protein